MCKNCAHIRIRIEKLQGLGQNADRNILYLFKKIGLFYTIAQIALFLRVYDLTLDG